MKKIYLIFLLIVMIPNTTHAEVEKGYDYANINACYLMGNNKAVKTEKQAGYDICLGSTTQAVDYTKLFCPEGYSLYNLKVSQGGTSKSGYGCRKEYTLEPYVETTLYCPYRLVHSIFIFLKITSDGTETKAEIKDANAFNKVDPPDYNSIYKEGENPFGWQNFRAKGFEFNGYKSGECPQAVCYAENTGYIDAQLVFFGDKQNSSGYNCGEFRSAQSKTETVTKYKKVYSDNSGSDPSPTPNPTPDPTPDPYYSTHYKPEDACTMIKEKTWDKVCRYTTGNEISISRNYIVYFNENEMYVALKESDWGHYGHIGPIETKFSFNEFYTQYQNDGGCPTLYYSPGSDDGTFWTSLYLNSYSYNRYELSRKSLAELVLPDYCFEPGNLELETNDCEGILGRPEEEGSVAYYLQMVFNIMKYVAIILLIGLTIMDFVGAITSHDDAQLKKATSKAVTRLIICVILFVLPTIIEFLMKVLDVYGDAGGCKIR